VTDREPLSERVMSGYRTIVADPPWEYPEGFALGTGHLERGERGGVEVRPLPYPSMTFDAICDLRVWELAAADCRLFLWTTNRWLDDAFDVMRAWRFKYRQTLVWHKRTMNLPAHIAPNSAEFVLVGTRGTPGRLSTLPSAVIATSRGGTDPQHSVKPECWLDHFEAVSPAPRLELFSRRARFGWDTWGNEALEHVSLAGSRRPT
jgi:N6-adenosine-specific RNA methylase IME4